jgi:hypothetical protein
MSCWFSLRRGGSKGETQEASAEHTAESGYIMRPGCLKLPQEHGRGLRRPTAVDVFRQAASPFRRHRSHR